MPVPPLSLDNSLEVLLGTAPDPSPAVLATVVATAGSTYRKAGARMFLYADGRHRGLLSGGCLEGDLAEHAQEVTRTGTARAVEYDMRGPNDALYGIGAGCEGAMRVLLEPAYPDSPALAALGAAREATAAGTPTVLVTVHDGRGGAYGTRLGGDAVLPRAVRQAVAEATRLGASVQVDERADRPTASPGLRALVHWLAPPPHVLVCGAGDDAVAVVAAARSLGWRVTVADHRPRYARGERFPGARVLVAAADALPAQVDLDRCHAAVVMSHHLEADSRYLLALARHPRPDHVSLLGPRSRRERLLAGDGADTATVLRGGLAGRLRGPAGLDIGAITPEGIALAVVADLHAHFAQRQATRPPPLGR